MGHRFAHPPHPISTLPEQKDQVCRFTSQTREWMESPAGVCVTTYTMVRVTHDACCYCRYCCAAAALVLLRWCCCPGWQLLPLQDPLHTQARSS